MTETKWCSKCKVQLPVEAFFNCATHIDGLSSWCAEHERIHVRMWNRQRRQAFLAAMGGKCVRCGFDDWRALQVDHINSDGAVERSEKGFRHDSNKWYAHVLATPDRYQLLCANCNQIKRIEKEETPGPRMLRNKPTHRFQPQRNLSKFPDWKCPNGHDPVAENIYIRKDGAKACRVCHKDTERRRRDRRRNG